VRLHSCPCDVFVKRRWFVNGLDCLERRLNVKTATSKIAAVIDESEHCCLAPEHGPHYTDKIQCSVQHCLATPAGLDVCRGVGVGATCQQFVKPGKILLTYSVEQLGNLVRSVSAPAALVFVWARIVAVHSFLLFKFRSLDYKIINFKNI